MIKNLSKKLILCTMLISPSVMGGQEVENDSFAKAMSMSLPRMPLEDTSISLETIGETETNTNLGAYVVVENTLGKQELMTRVEKRGHRALADKDFATFKYLSDTFPGAFADKDVARFQFLSDQLPGQHTIEYIVATAVANGNVHLVADLIDTAKKTGVTLDMVCDGLESLYDGNNPKSLGMMIFFLRGRDLWSLAKDPRERNMLKQKIDYVFHTAFEMSDNQRMIECMLHNRNTIFPGQKLLDGLLGRVRSFGNIGRFRLLLDLERPVHPSIPATEGFLKACAGDLSLMEDAGTLASAAEKLLEHLRSKPQPSVIAHT